MRGPSSSKPLDREARDRDAATPHFPDTHPLDRPATPDEMGDPDDAPVSGRLRFRTIWISDTHLGTPGCQAHALLEFLRRTESDYLFLVGDIIDGWQLKRKWYWHQRHNDVIQKVLRKARKGTAVVYIPGNHDEAARHYLGLAFGGIAIRDEAIHVTARRPAPASHARRLLRRRGPVRALAGAPGRRSLRLHAAAQPRISITCARASACRTGRCRSISSIA